MSSWIKKCRTILLMTVMVTNAATPLLSVTAFADADAKTTATADKPATNDQSALAIHKAKRLAAMKKDWADQSKAALKVADKAQAVFVELKDPAAYKDAPEPTGTKANVAEIKGDIEEVIADQTPVTKQAETITGAEVTTQSGYLVNGFAISASPKEVIELEKQADVLAVYPVNTYQPMDTDALELGNAIKAWNSNGVEHKGDGIVVADIDSGIDVKHRDLSFAPPKQTLTQATINNMKTAKHLPGKYYTPKVPYGYNYAENNDEIFDSGINHFHGMHVAGIIAADGTDYVKQQAYNAEMKLSGNKTKAEAAKKAAKIQGNADVDGVAPHAQLLAMKVFANNSRGAMTPVIIKAIEDSVMLGADVMNLSLGSVCTGSENDIEETVLNNAAKLGVLPVVAAGNNGNYAGLHRNGTTEQKAIKEQQTVGAFSSAKDALVVASENNSRRMVSSVSLVDPTTKQEIFKDITCLQNYTAEVGGFKFYDKNDPNYDDPKYDWVTEGSTTVNGQRVAFGIQPVASGVKEQREMLDAYFAEHPNENAAIDPMDTMSFSFEPSPQAYKDGVNAAKTVKDLKQMYDKYFPTEATSAVKLGQGYQFDFNTPYKLSNGEDREPNYANNIVMVNESELNTYEITNVVKAKHVQGLIIVSDDPKARPGVDKSDYFFENSESLPAIMISQSDGEKLKAYFSTPAGNQQKVQILRTPTRLDSANAGKMSSYSSWGLTPELNFKPEITAPGANIWSTVNDNQFAEMSGTSMATPYVAGAEALLMQDLKQTKLTGIDKVRAAKVRMENSSTPVYETYVKDGKTIKAINSVRQQGAGAINVAKALENQTLLNVHGKMEGTLSLKQINGSQKFQVDVTNNSKKSKSYTIDDNTGTFYGQTTAPAPTDSTTKVLHEYPLDKAAVALVPSVKTFTVKPGVTQTINVNLNITSKQAKDAWLEGYFGIKEVGSNNTNVLPIVAYYGNLDKETIIDPFKLTDKSILESANLAPEKDDFQYGYGYRWDSKNKVYHFDANDVWYSSSTNPDVSPARKYIYHNVNLTRNAKTLHGYVTDPKGQMLQNGKTLNDIGRNYCSAEDVEGNVSYADFGWDGTVVDPKSSARKPATEGDYMYHLEATSELPGAKLQTQNFPIHVDQTKPVAKGLKIEKRGNDYYLVGEVSDTGAGFGAQRMNEHFFISINKQEDFISTSELLGSQRSKKIVLNYKLSKPMVNSFIEGDNEIVFSMMDFADNWIDEVIHFKNGGDVATNFKVTKPAQPTIWKAGEDYKTLVEPVEPLSALDPYHVTTPGIVVEGLLPRWDNQLDDNYKSENYDSINHKVKVEGTAPASFYVNGQKVTPDKLNHFSEWIQYNPNAADIFRDNSPHPIIYLTFSSDAAGKDILAKRPVKLTGTWSAPNLTIDKKDGTQLYVRGESDLYTTIEMLGISENYSHEELFAKLGVSTWKDIDQSYVVSTHRDDLNATFNVTKTSGNVHVINKTTGEKATDSQTIITKPTPDANTVTRKLALKEGFNVVQSYTDEFPDQILNMVIYYTTKKMAADIVTLDNFDFMKSADWNSVKKQYTLRGTVGDDIASLKILGNSTDLNDPKNQVKIEGNTWSYAAKMDADYGYRTWTLVMTHKNGQQTKTSIGGYYDFVVPELQFTDAAKWQGNEQDGYDVYTNNTTFTIKGIAKDNASGFWVYVNGSFLLADQGVTSAQLSAGTPRKFSETYNLEKNHMTDFEWGITDRLSNRKFVHIRVHQGKS